MAKRRSGRPERDDSSAVFHGCRAKQENPELSGFALAKEAFSRAGIYGATRRDLDRVAKKIERRISSGEVPGELPMPAAARALAEKLDQEKRLRAQGRVKIPDQIAALEQELREVGIDPSGDLGRVYRSISSEIEDLEVLLDGPAKRMVFMLDSAGHGTADEKERAWRQAKDRMANLQKQAHAISQLDQLRKS